MKIKKAKLRKEIKHLRQTIFLKCLECNNCHQASGQIKEVIECDITGCPLWGERPLEAKGLFTLIRRLRKIISTSSEADK
ncbi:MAG: hypothetical protein NTZ55_04455 [Candidatus Roizmanbacteria bacterium]|nr:hypothetical protein [Candidatus Roizmanbacteria bacterium]